LKAITRTTRLLIFLFLISCGARAALAVSYGVAGNPETDTVSFASSATLEFIEGKTTKLVGGFDFDPTHPDSAVTGMLRADLASLKTGIELRDEHMREKNLQTDKFPYAYFQLLSVSGMPDTVKPGEVYSVVGDGYFFIHGVKRKIAPRIQFLIPTDVDSDSKVNVSALFSLKLDDYGIKRPKALFLKLAETIDVSVMFSAHKDLSVADIQLPEWSEVQ